MSKDPLANYFVQKLLINCRTNKQVSRCSHEIRPFITELLPTKPGVIVALLDISRKYDVKMDKIYHDVISILLPSTNKEEDDEEEEKKTIERDIINNMLYFNSKYVFIIIFIFIFVESNKSSICFISGFIIIISTNLFTRSKKSLVR